MTLLTDALRARIGESVTYTAPEYCGRPAFRYFAEAVGDDNPLYVDVDAARAVGLDTVVAPPTWICETNQYVGGPADEDGYAGHSWHLDVPGTRLVRGGNSYEFHRHVRPIDVLTVTWRIVDMAERTTSAGQPMLVVTSEATYTRADGALLATNTETLVFVALDGAVA